MATTFRLCDEKIHAMIRRVMHEHHADLERENVTVQAIMATAEGDEEIIPALKNAGYPIAAKIQVTSLQDRIRGLPDAKLTIDDYAWSAISESRREALIDHELEHLDIVLRATKLGIVVARDDCGRTKLRIKAHDWELTGFAAVVERHGEASIESLQIVRFSETYGQLCLFPLPGTEALKPKRASRAKLSDEVLDERDPAVLASQQAMATES